MIFSITIEDRPTTNQIPSISLKTPFSVAKEETTKGWRGPSGTLEGVYIDGAAPTLKDLTSVFVGLGVHSVSATILAGSVFYSYKAEHKPSMETLLDVTKRFP